MKRSPKSFPYRSGMILVAVLTAGLMSFPARAQSAPSRLSSANPAPGGVQVPPAATDSSGQVVVPLEQQRMEAQLREPYRVAAAIVAADRPAPKLIASVGAFQGQFLAAFLDQFPDARGQYTEPDSSKNPPIAKQRMARFGDRVTFVVGCPSRDISTGCVPKDADIIITEWVSIHLDLDGIYKTYRAAAEQLPLGGWFVNLDHVSFGGTAWENWLAKAAKDFRPEHEGPGLHHPDFRVPTVEEQLGAMRAAGFDARVVWQSFNTVLFMARKN